MQSTGKLQLSENKVCSKMYNYKLFFYQLFILFVFKVYDFTSDDLQDLGEIGRGGFGTVNKMLHRSSDTVMAVKVSNTYTIYIIIFYINFIQTLFNYFSE